MYKLVFLPCGHGMLYDFILDGSLFFFSFSLMYIIYFIYSRDNGIQPLTVFLSLPDVCLFELNS